MVIHCAALAGGGGSYRAHPGKVFYHNAIMGIQLIEACRRYGVEKTVLLGTIRAYSQFSPVPFREEDLWSGGPGDNDAPYAIAKKALLVQARAYRREYGMNIIYLLPVDLYGPRDNFDPGSAHVIPALIRKCVEAVEGGAEEFVCWGDGSPIREFLYVDDCAEGVVAATERYDGPEPVNLGSGQEISIRDLAARIAGITGFRGRIVWDRTQPNGHPRRSLDGSRARREFGFEARTPFEEGLRRTIAWYQAASRENITA